MPRLRRDKKRPVTINLTKPEIFISGDCRMRPHDEAFPWNNPQCLKAISHMVTGEYDGVTIIRRMFDDFMVLRAYEFLILPKMVEVLSVLDQAYGPGVHYAAIGS